MAQMIKNLPAMQEQQEMQFRSLGQDDSLEKEMTTHFGILSWEIPRTGSLERLQSMESQ